MHYALSNLNSGNCMQWLQFFIVALLVLLPATGSASSKPYVCVGKYKDGGRPDQAALKKILDEHAAWLGSGLNENDVRQANLCRADLSKAKLRRANLSKAKLQGANLNGADMRNAKLIGADMSRAKLNRAKFFFGDLSEANLNEAELSEAILDAAQLNGADLNGANLNGATLIFARLKGANLTRANLTEADLLSANLTGANLTSANLTGANLSSATLTEANLFEANLTGADLSYAELINAELIKTILRNANFININLKRARYESNSTPEFLNGIKNLDTVRFASGYQSGLVSLRNSLRESGLRELERKATYVIEKGKTDYTSSLLEKFARRLFFESTAGYGLYPGKSLIILLSFIPLFSLIYFFSVYKKKESPGQRQSGIYRIWVDDRIRKDLGSDEPELIYAGFLKSLGYAFYFSFLSAFHIGWRDVNVGSWITRIQPHEYILRSTGWVRTVSGIQSLISIYLLAFWVLTQFGRPFD